MKHSAPGRQLALQAALLATDVVGRLTFPVALLALARGATDASILAAAAVTVAGTLRGFVLGTAIESTLRRNWRALTAASRAQPVAHRSEVSPERVTLLLEAVREGALFEAMVVPQLLSQALALAIVAVAVVLLLGVAWLGLGVAAFAVLGLLMALGHRRVRSAQETAWSGYREVARDMHALVAASSELQAHARDGALEQMVLLESDRMARAERIANAWSGVAGLVPAGLAIVALAVPAKAGIGWITDVLGSARVADVAVLGGAAVVLGVGLARTAEAAVRTLPQRRMLAEFLRSGRRVDSARGKLEDADLRGSIIEFVGVSHVYAGAAHATPAPVDHAWRPGKGLAVTGLNGAGKSTLAMVLLGLLTPTTGHIAIGGARVVDLDLDDLHARVAYLPQGAFVAPAASIGWHLRLLSPDATDEQLEAALVRVGLLEAVRQHAHRAGASVLEVPAGELSGGERQRMHLARVLLRRADLIVLDEPEVGLDEAGRRMLQALIEDLAGTHRVLLIAHDESLIPARFERLRAARGDAPAPSVDFARA